jgi:hypothetical protein
MAFFNGNVQALSRRSAASLAAIQGERSVNHNEVPCAQAFGI